MIESTIKYHLGYLSMPLEVQTLLSWRLKFGIGETFVFPFCPWRGPAPTKDPKTAYKPRTPLPPRGVIKHLSWQPTIGRYLDMIDMMNG